MLENFKKGCPFKAYKKIYNRFLKRNNKIQYNNLSQNKNKDQKMKTLINNYIGTYNLQNIKELYADKVWNEIKVGTEVALRCVNYENKVELAVVKDKEIGILPKDGKLEVVRKLLELREDLGGDNSLFECTISRKSGKEDIDTQLAVTIRIKIPD